MAERWCRGRRSWWVRPWGDNGAERAFILLTAIPGDTKALEAGTIAILIALGTNPTSTLAGVLVLRARVLPLSAGGSLFRARRWLLRACVLAETLVGGLATALWPPIRRFPARAAV